MVSCGCHERQEVNSLWCDSAPHSCQIDGQTDAQKQFCEELPGWCIQLVHLQSAFGCKSEMPLQRKGARWISIAFNVSRNRVSLCHYAVASGKAARHQVLLHTGLLHCHSSDCFGPTHIVIHAAMTPHLNVILYSGSVVHDYQQFEHNCPSMPCMCNTCCWSWLCPRPDSEKAAMQEKFTGLQKAMSSYGCQYLPDGLLKATGKHLTPQVQRIWRRHMDVRLCVNVDT